MVPKNPSFLLLVISKVAKPAVVPVKCGENLTPIAPAGVRLRSKKHPDVMVAEPKLQSYVPRLDVENTLPMYIRLAYIDHGSFCQKFAAMISSKVSAPCGAQAHCYVPYCFQGSQRSCRSHTAHCFCSSVPPIQLPVLSVHCSFLDMLCILEAHYMVFEKDIGCIWESLYSLQSR